MPPEKLIIALAGNPNAGKTTIFNNITGGRQHVGNWPGVTVEKKEGTARANGIELSVVDLPGTYSLTAYSMDEVVVRDYIAQEHPDVVVDVIDSSNIERNLYLTSLLMELEVPVVAALNMMDVAEGRGVKVDVPLLSKLLGVRVVPMVGVKKEGTDELKEAVLEAAAEGKLPAHVNYGRELEEEIANIEKTLSEGQPDLHGYSPRWVAIRLLEQDPRVEDMARVSEDSPVGKQVEASSRHLESISGDDVETLVVDNRYGFVAGVVREAVKRRAGQTLTTSDRIDRVLTGRIMGLPIFVFFMWLMFFLTFFIGKIPMRWLGSLIKWISSGVGLVLASPHWLHSLLIDGVIGGVGSVLVFLPQIFIIFICISILEDTGYMARAAFLMDRVMHAFGLHGKSFIPMLMGFGCNVPAVMATRTLESEKDRMITILVNPLMSCAARLPIYALFTAAFFAANQGSVTLSLYLLGVILAVIMAKVFRRFLFKGKSEPFVMELPPYRWPTARGTLTHVWERASLFLKKAGTVILAGSVIVWFLSYMPPGVKYGSANSLAGTIGRLLAPLVKPLGFDWRAAVALLMGFFGKEIVVSTYGALLGVGGNPKAISVRLQTIFTPLTAYTFMAFTLLYTPCLATLAVIRRETKSWKWTFFAVGYSLILAWLVAFFIYRVGRLFGLPG